MKTAVLETMLSLEENGPKQEGFGNRYIRVNGVNATRCQNNSVPPSTVLFLISGVVGILGANRKIPARVPSRYTRNETPALPRRVLFVLGRPGNVTS